MYVSHSPNVEYYKIIQPIMNASDPSWDNNDLVFKIDKETVRLGRIARSGDPCNHELITGFFIYFKDFHQSATHQTYRTFYEKLVKAKVDIFVQGPLLSDLAGNSKSFDIQSIYQKCLPKCPNFSQTDLWSVIDSKIRFLLNKCLDDAKTPKDFQITLEYGVYRIDSITSRSFDDKTISKETIDALRVSTQKAARLVDHIFAVDFPGIAKSLENGSLRADGIKKFLSNDFKSSFDESALQPSVAEIPSAQPVRESNSLFSRLYRSVLSPIKALPIAAPGPSPVVVEADIGEVDSDSAGLDPDIAEIDPDTNKFKKRRLIVVDPSKKRRLTAQEVREDISPRRKGPARDAKLRQAHLTDRKEPGGIPKSPPKKAKQPPIRRKAR